MSALVGEATLYAFDFDGTLAPIVQHPGDAHASAATTALLATLGSCVPIAILTGRAVADLRSRLAFEPRHVVGNHGAEGLPSMRSTLEEPDDVRITRAWVAQWPDAIAGAYGPEPDDPGIAVEDKQWSLSIHYRNARHPDDAARRVARAIASLVPAPHVIDGKRVANLMPTAGTDKGTALAALVRHEGCTRAFYIGDDVTDELAFASAAPDWVTVRVGRSWTSAARFYVETRDEVDGCIARLVELMRAAGRC